jgi:hypothetical protein
MTLWCLCFASAGWVLGDRSGSAEEPPVVVAEEMAAHSPQPDASPVRHWLVRTHGLGDPGAHVADLQQLDVQLLAGDQWQLSTATQLAESTRERTTVIYIHGNRGSDGEAIERGMRIGATLAARDGCPPLQMVIWSWPSAQVQRGRRDFLIKAERADTEAWYLSALLDQFPVGVDVGLIGYSYGARVVTGAMHWIAGGEFEGRTFASLAGPSLPLESNPLLVSTAAQSPERHVGRYRIALLAPAIHQDWLATHGCHREAFRSTARLLLLYNTCDPALRWYRFVYRCEKPEAVGKWGLPSDWLGPWSDRVDQWDVAPVIGKTHDEDAYLGAAWITGQIGDTLLGLPAAD